MSGSGILNGGDGNDRITGNGELVGGAGDDTLVVQGSANTTLLGGDGDDTLVAGSGNDALDGGSGTDLAIFALSSSLLMDLAAEIENVAADARGEIGDDVGAIENTDIDELGLPQAAGQRVVASVAFDRQ